MGTNSHKKRFALKRLIVKWLHFSSPCFSPASDINECLVANGDCEHICTNTGGSSECSCGDGYRLGSDGQSCSGWYDPLGWVPIHIKV